jgi:DNA (cytosine-5)-methyltransferase 1
LSFPVRPFGFVSTFRQRQRQRSQKFKEIAQAAIRKQYGVKRPFTPRASRKFDERYFVRRAGHFEREQHSEKLRATDPGQCIYEVGIEDDGAAIGLSFARTDARARSLTSGLISISGLSKYLGRIDSLTAHLKILDVSDLFHAWASIEQALVSRSRFFTLIDIYGHYANRGDTVRIKCDYGLDQDWPLHRSLDYFGNSLCCGEFMPLARLARELSISEREMKKVICAMRSERFDIRTNVTHPIIGKGRVICTYPFPLLSAKALVESRVQFLSDESLPRQARIAV